MYSFLAREASSLVSVTKWGRSPCPVSTSPGRDQEISLLPLYYHMTLRLLIKAWLEMEQEAARGAEPEPRRDWLFPPAQSASTAANVCFGNFSSLETALVLILQVLEETVTYACSSEGLILTDLWTTRSTSEDRRR
ncbi:hypothetical protein RRG08_011870 [Elysia crispata]|uniref:Uncharacterized protein n=1 Tax=Elysia crispata TaxID=231223 RepID=A0AAE0ZNZ0_9GAST|nr:hypothetical protein RRG08_011870 [Elysia crispata]